MFSSVESLKINPLSTMGTPILVLFREYFASVTKFARKMKPKNMGAKCFVLGSKTLKDMLKIKAERFESSRESVVDLFLKFVARIKKLLCEKVDLAVIFCNRLKKEVMQFPSKPPIHYLAMLFSVLR